MSWAGVVLAAGNGVRMRSRIPKVLHPLCGAPMLQHAAGAVREAGIDRLVVVASPAVANLPEFKGAAGTSAVIAVQAEQKGTANALLAAREACGDARFVISIHGDAPLLKPETLRQLLEAHESSRSTVTVLTASGGRTDGMGRVRRDKSGAPIAITEERDADAKTRSITEVNSGCYCFDARWLWRNITNLWPSDSGETYLTDIVALAVRAGRKTAAVKTADPEEVLGVNDRVQLADAERVLRGRVRHRWMVEGATLTDPDSVFIDVQATIQPDTVIHANTHLLGETSVGAGCVIGPNTILKDTIVGDDSRVVASLVEESSIGTDVSVGPFSRLRAGAIIEDGAVIGNCAEIKNSRIGAGSHVSHFSYVGDALLGRGVNIGAGAVTCNYDGVSKHRTTIGDNVFIGSGTMMIAPVIIGDSAATAANAVVNRDVPGGIRVAGVPAKPMPAKKPVDKR